MTRVGRPVVRMPFIRTTVATLIALAVALLPASGNAILLPSSAEVAMTGHADMPCCPSCDTQACDTHGDFKAAVCALKCAALASAVLPVTSIAPLYIAESSLRALAEDAVHRHVIAPLHPPPI
jgi:hypothetical protein